ncbi:MAG: hypothetical protein U1F43_27375 [Myxococcota bacterium]
MGIGSPRASGTGPRARLAGLVSVAFVAASCLALGAGLAGCALEDPFFTDPSCDPSLGTVDLAGAWTLRGTGTDLTGCDGLKRLVIGPGHFDVTQQGTVLALARPAGSFSLTGGLVQGQCVQFTTSESLGGGASQSITFQGKASGHAVVGTFDMLSSAACSVSGSFELTIVPPSP